MRGEVPAGCFLPAASSGLLPRRLFAQGAVVSGADGTLRNAGRNVLSRVGDGAVFRFQKSQAGGRRFVRSLFLSGGKSTAVADTEACLADATAAVLFAERQKGFVFRFSRLKDAAGQKECRHYGTEFLHHGTYYKQRGLILYKSLVIFVVFFIFY